MRKLATCLILLALPALLGACCAYGDCCDCRPKEGWRTYLVDESCSPAPRGTLPPTVVTPVGR